MNDPVVGLAAAWATLGLWGVLTGRRLLAWPGWALDGRAIRMVGAYELLTGFVVIAVALTHHDFIAFLIYAVLSLILFLTLQIVSNRRAAA
jgi:hypothetical protein